MFVLTQNKHTISILEAQLRDLAKHIEAHLKKNSMLIKKRVVGYLSLAETNMSQYIKTKLNKEPCLISPVFVTKTDEEEAKCLENRTIKELSKKLKPSVMKCKCCRKKFLKKQSETKRKTTILNFFTNYLM